MTKNLAEKLKAAEKKLTTTEQEKTKATKNHQKARHDVSELKRKADTRRKIVVGGVMFKHAELDAGFKKHLTQLIDTHVTAKADRALFEDFGIKLIKDNSITKVSKKSK